MKKDKYLSLALFVIFSALGAYFLHDSLYDPGEHAEEGVLFGALLLASALAAFAWAIRQHLMSKALHRHLRRRQS
jgi:hypothetical protein